MNISLNVILTYSNFYAIFLYLSLVEEIFLSGCTGINRQAIEELRAKGVAIKIDDIPEDINTTYS